MSLYWFVRWLGHEIKKSLFKIFIWRLPNPEKHRKNNPAYAYHVNPYLIGWVGFFTMIFGYIRFDYSVIAFGISLIILAYLLRLYWKGEWRTYRKKMEAVE